MKIKIDTPVESGHTSINTVDYQQIRTVGYEEIIYDKIIKLEEQVKIINKKLDIKENLEEEKTKAVLVLDMPKKCSECTLSNSGTGPSDDWSCDGVQEKIETITGKHLVNKKIKLKNINKIQSWCPLKTMPEKRWSYGRFNSDGESWYEETVYDLGYNRCLQDIFGDIE